MTASAAVTAMLPVAVAPQGSRPRRFIARMKKKSVSRYGSVSLAVMTHVRQDHFLPDVERRGLHRAGEPLGAAGPSPAPRAMERALRTKTRATSVAASSM